MIRASYYLHPKFLFHETILFGFDATYRRMQYQNNTPLPLKFAFNLSAITCAVLLYTLDMGYDEYLRPAKMMQSKNKEMAPNVNKSK